MVAVLAVLGDNLAVAELLWVVVGLLLRGVLVFCCMGNLVRSFFWLSE